MRPQGGATINAAHGHAGLLLDGRHRDRRHHRDRDLPGQHTGLYAGIATRNRQPIRNTNCNRNRKRFPRLGWLGRGM